MPVKFTAIYKEQRNSSMKEMVKTYSFKKDFASALRGNGFRVLAILTDEEIAKMKTVSEDEAVMTKSIRMDVWNFCQQVL